MTALLYSQIRSPRETLISHPQGRCPSHVNNLLSSLCCNEDQAPATGSFLCCADASRFSNFQEENYWIQAQHCTESVNHHAETLALQDPQGVANSQELKETLANGVEK